jgi:hypothetical protein
MRCQRVKTDCRHKLGKFSISWVAQTRRDVRRGHDQPSQYSVSDGGTHRTQLSESHTLTRWRTLTLWEITTLLSLELQSTLFGFKFKSLGVVEGEGNFVIRKTMPSSFFTVQQDGSSLVEERVTEHTLDDAPILPGRLHELNARGRTCKSSFHPLFSQGFTWISEKQVNTRMQSSFIVCSTSIYNLCSK